MEVQILQGILDAHQASEIADDMNFASEEEAAEFYFNETYYEGEWEIDNMPKYNQFVKSIEGGDLYYDYGANYYFLVREVQMNESKKQVIRLTESQLHSFIKETVNKILREQEDTSWFTGDYTEEEKKSMEKKEKNAKRAKKAAETRLQKKKDKERKEEEEFLNTQKKRGYKGLFENSPINVNNITEEEILNIVKTALSEHNCEITDYDVKNVKRDVHITYEGEAVAAFYSDTVDIYVTGEWYGEVVYDEDDRGYSYSEYNGGILNINEVEFRIQGGSFIPCQINGIAEKIYQLMYKDEYEKIWNYHFEGILEHEEEKYSDYITYMKELASERDDK